MQFTTTQRDAMGAVKPRTVDRSDISSCPISGEFDVKVYSLLSCD